MRLSIDLTGPAEARFKAMLAANGQLGTAPLVKAMFSALFGPDFLRADPTAERTAMDARVGAIVMAWSLLDQRPNLVGPDGVCILDSVESFTPQASPLPRVVVHQPLVDQSKQPDVAVADPTVVVSPEVHDGWITTDSCPETLRRHLEDANAALESDGMAHRFIIPDFEHITTMHSVGDKAVVSGEFLCTLFKIDYGDIMATKEDPEVIEVNTFYVCAEDIPGFVRAGLQRTYESPAEYISAATPVAKYLSLYAQGLNKSLPLWRTGVTLGKYGVLDLFWTWA